ncbi:hypothetical protein NIES25_04510 [Nostoc linckia NIES-25]|nr:hypothetical protein NIES25_04510 [Nostoc linckia NIES-25]
MLCLDTEFTGQDLYRLELADLLGYMIAINTLWSSSIGMYLFFYTVIKAVWEVYAASLKLLHFFTISCVDIARLRYRFEIFHTQSRIQQC